MIWKNQWEKKNKEKTNNINKHIFLIVPVIEKNANNTRTIQQQQQKIDKNHIKIKYFYWRCHQSYYYYFDFLIFVVFLYRCHFKISLKKIFGYSIFFLCTINLCKDVRILFFCVTWFSHFSFALNLFINNSKKTQIVVEWSTLWLHKPSPLFFLYRTAVVHPLFFSGLWPI